MKLNVVLVRPKYAFNVGSVSRVMANIGADRLILIDSLCELDQDARKGAAGAQTRLIEADLYKNWADFLAKEPEGIRLAFCGKDKKQMESKNFSEKVPSIIAEATRAGFQNTYLIFGTEDDGLSDEDLEFANHILTLPAYGEFRSLNLSHAVLMALFIYDQARRARNVAPAQATSNAEIGFYFPEQALKNWLTTIGFDLENRDTSAYTVLKRLLLSRLPSKKELRVLESIVNQTVRKLRETREP
jgi:tRNA/rRNA methyltransferase